MTTPPTLRKPVPEPMAPQELEELEKVAPLLEGAQLMGPQGERHPVPAALYNLMRDLLEHLQRGESSLLSPMMLCSPPSRPPGSSTSPALTSTSSWRLSQSPA